MKAIIFFAIVGLAFSAPRPRSLTDDLQDFINLLPIDQVKEIADAHLNNDGGFVAVVEYLQGDEWAQLVQEVVAKQAVQDFIQYLTKAGLPIDDYIESIRNFIHDALPGTQADENGSLRPLLDEVESILPVDKLLDLLNKKLQSSADFQALYIKVSSEDAHALVEEVRAIPEVQRLAQRLRDFGVKVDEVLAVIYGFLGWDSPKESFLHPRSLTDDLQDFINLLPIDEIKEIAAGHLNNDGAFVAVVEYLQGDEWAQLVQDVGSKQAVQDFIQYLTKAGLPIEDYIEAIHNFIHDAVPGTQANENGSLRPLLDEVESILPVDKLLDLLNKKLQSSADFQALYIEVSSEGAHALVEEVRAIPEVQRLAQRLRDFGVKVDEVLAVIYGFLGWDSPKESLLHPRSLTDDLQDFINLLSVDEIKEIAAGHLNNDGAFVAVVEHLQGDEWAQLVQDVGSKEAVQDFIQYLTKAGLPIEDYIEAIHNFIHDAVPGTQANENGSLRPLLDEVESILPVDKLLDLLNKKLQSSADFQALYIEVSSEDAHALVEEVRAIPEVQRLAQRLRDFGVKVDEALAVIYGFLGWDSPKESFLHPRSLTDDLQDFINLLPIDEIKEIAAGHLNNDGAFVAVVEYLQGDEWAQLVEQVGSKQAVQDFIEYLTKAGLPIDDYIAAIHDFIHNAVPGTQADEDGSLRPLLDEVESILPVDKLLDLLNKKLQNSADFQALYTEVSSEDAHVLVEEVRAIPEVQRLAQRLRDFGVKVDVVLAVIYGFLGWDNANIV